MSSMKKQRAVFPLEDPPSEDENQTSSDGDLIGENIDVEFEAFSASDNDYDGIQKLLQQMFRGFAAEISSLTDIIISQNYIGSVIKQVYDDEEEDVENVTEEEKNEVYGITTLINITARKEEPCISSLRSELIEKCSRFASDSTCQYMRETFGDDNKHIGLLISERLVNLPSQLALPVFDSLLKELEEARKKKMAYKFDLLLMVCKIFKLNQSKSKGNKKQTNLMNLDPVLWSNQEEELFEKESIGTFEFELGSPPGLTGSWEEGEGEGEYSPWRKVLIFPAEKLTSIVSSIRQSIS